MMTYPQRLRTLNRRAFGLARFVLCVGLVIAGCISASPVDAQDNPFRLTTPRVPLPGINPRPAPYRESLGVNIYTNGAHHLVRTYDFLVDKGEIEISLEIKRDHLEAFFASYVFSDDSMVVEQPSFERIDQLVQMSVDPANPSKSLFENSSGQAIHLTPRGASEISGTLAGLEKDSESGASYVVLNTESGQRRVALREIEVWQFDDVKLQTALKRALSVNAQRLQEGTTTVTFTVKASPRTSLKLHYYLPGAAPKLSYRLRKTENGPLGYDLLGIAHVDNSTAEDWSDVKMSVIRGEPLVYQTNLPDLIFPRRQQVNLGPDQSGRDHLIPMGAAAASMSRGMNRSSMMDAEFAPMESAPSVIVNQSKESDFAVFKLEKPQSIARAGGARAVQLFKFKLPAARSIVYHRPDHGTTERAVHFTNEAHYALGRGICSIYVDDGAFGGQHVLELMNSKEDRLVSLSSDRGVLTDIEHRPMSIQRISFGISDGEIVSVEERSVESVYSIRNTHSQSFEYLFEHRRQLGTESTLEITERNAEERPIFGASTQNRIARYAVPLAALDRKSLIVTETQSITRKVSADNIRNIRSWISQEIVRSNHPLLNDPQFAEVKSTLAALKSAEAEYAIVLESLKALLITRDELRENLKVLQNAEWERRFIEAQTKIEDHRSNLSPTAADKVNNATVAFEAAVRALDVNYSS